MEAQDFEKSKILVDELLKKSDAESTEKVYVSLNNGQRVGPFIRKVFNNDIGLGQIYKMFYNEAGSRNLNLCDYNLPTVYYANDLDDKLYVYEEFFDGERLDTFIAHNKASLDLISKVMQKLIAAVKTLHEGFFDVVIHRDIKPSNILVKQTHDGVDLRLIDFGISRNFVDGVQNDTYKYGTIGYAPPEQFGFKQTDERSDIYSLGKVLEFLVDNSNCPDNENENQHFQNDLFDTIISKSTSFDPSKRYKNIDAFSTAFTQATQGGNLLYKIEHNKTLNVLGWIWNCIISIFAIMSIVVVVCAMVVPGNSSVGNYALDEKLVYSFVLICLVILPAWFLFLFKPAIRRVIVKLPKFRWYQLVGFAGVCIALTFLIAGFVR